MEFGQMVGINNLDELELFQYQEFFQLVLLSKLDIQVYQQREGTFNLQSIRHHIYFPYRDRSDEFWVCSSKSPNDRVLGSLRTMFLWVLSICDRIRRTCCSNVGLDFLLIRFD